MSELNKNLEHKLPLSFIPKLWTPLKQRTKAKTETRWKMLRSKKIVFSLKEQKNVSRERAFGNRPIRKQIGPSRYPMWEEPQQCFHTLVSFLLSQICVAWWKIFPLLNYKDNTTLFHHRVYLIMASLDLAALQRFLSLFDLACQSVYHLNLEEHPVRHLVSIILACVFSNLKNVIPFKFRFLPFKVFIVN